MATKARLMNSNYLEPAYPPHSLQISLNQGKKKKQMGSAYFKIKLIKDTLIKQN